MNLYSYLRRLAKWSIECEENLLHANYDIVYLRKDSHCNYFINGKAYCCLLDSLQNYIDEALPNPIKAITIAPVDALHHGEKSYSETVTFRVYFARALLLRWIFYPFSKLEAQISKRLNITRGDFDFFTYLAWKKVLKKLQPKVIIGFQPGSSICRAAHKLGIWIADYQHGVINESHPWYNSANNSQIQKESLPSAYLCWDSFSATTIKKWASKKGIDSLVLHHSWFIKNLCENLKKK